jgi:hypothetical protein
LTENPIDVEEERQERGSGSGSGRKEEIGTENVVFARHQFSKRSAGLSI